MCFIESGCTGNDSSTSTSTTRQIQQSMIVSPDYCRVLGTSGTKTYIEFNCCIFQDEGAAFVEASAARQDGCSGCIPFNERNLTLFLSQNKLEFLELDSFEFDCEVSCTAVATAEVQYMQLVYCDFEDGWEALLWSNQSGMATVVLENYAFAVILLAHHRSFVDFMYAMRGSKNLERLDLLDIHAITRNASTPAAAMHGNKGLIVLGCPHVCLAGRVSFDIGGDWIQRCAGPCWWVDSMFGHSARRQGWTQLTGLDSDSVANHFTDRSFGYGAE
jgi:hypothetical protein